MAHIRQSIRSNAVTAVTGLSTSLSTVGKIASSIDGIIYCPLIMGAATLGSVFEKYKLNAICNDCGRCKELDVAALKDKYGDDFEVPCLSKMVKCTKCGSPHGCVVHLGNLYDPKMG